MRTLKVEAGEYRITEAGSHYINNSYIYRVIGRGDQGGVPSAFISPIRTEKTGKESSFNVQANNSVWVFATDIELV